jgi:hypothetical protein
VTAEFAITLPAVAVVLAVGLGALSLGTRQLLVQEAAGTAARTVARGEGVEAARSRALAIAPGVRVAFGERSGLHCATVSTGGSVLGLLGAVTLSASSCSL